jgi:hypothetical protein
MENPYLPPQSAGNLWQPTESSREAAQAQVRGPAICLLVTSVLWMLGLVAAIGFDIFLVTSGMAEDMRPGRVFDKQTEVTVRGVGSLVLLGLQGVTVAGAVSMMQLKRPGLAKASAILAVIPCCSACYVLGIPFGIWALVVLNRPEVSSHFS